MVPRGTLDRWPGIRDPLEGLNAAGLSVGSRRVTLLGVLNGIIAENALALSLWAYGKFLMRHHYFHGETYSKLR
jgi:hypothetical protein